MSNAHYIYRSSLPQLIHCQNAFSESIVSLWHRHQQSSGGSRLAGITEPGADAAAAGAAYVSPCSCLSQPALQGTPSPFRHTWHQPSRRLSGRRHAMPWSVCRFLAGDRAREWALEQGLDAAQEADTAGQVICNTPQITPHTACVQSLLPLSSVAECLMSCWPADACHFSIQAPVAEISDNAEDCQRGRSNPDIMPPFLEAKQSALRHSPLVPWKSELRRLRQSC